MFASKVDVYNTYDVIAERDDRVTRFDTHPLFEHIADLSDLRKAHPALADGAQVHRYATSGPGIFATSASERAPGGRNVDQVEYVVAANNDTERHRDLRDVDQGPGPCSHPSTAPTRPSSRRLRGR